MTSHIVCTAANALEHNRTRNHGIRSIHELLRYRALKQPSLLCAGFPELDEHGVWQCLSLTCDQLWRSSAAAGRAYEAAGLALKEQSETIAILSPSCADFLVTLCALWQKDCAVLLIAPQNSPEAVAHLCATTGATRLIAHSSLSSLAEAALRTSMSCTTLAMVARASWHSDATSHIVVPAQGLPELPDKIALIMHTSGSTGMPKPVGHPHRVWTSCLSDQGEAEVNRHDPSYTSLAALTTTPLYHGGISDWLRAMVSRATTYFFSSTYSITADHLIGAVASCREIRSFLTVPYILRLLSESKPGIAMLKAMALVSTGGAPLDEKLGDSLTSQGVYLVSRLGSSEAGFLLTSDRLSPETDQAWSWLRNDTETGRQMLRFEPATDERYELVVDAAWPPLVVRNRNDGRYATGDLYEKHATLDHAWRYAGRVDDLLVLENGKKVAAGSIESTLTRSQAISTAVVFGAHRSQIGVIVEMTGTREEVMKVIEAHNKSSPNYAQILKSMIIYTNGAEIPKSSKGTVLRGRALQEYASQIDLAYQQSAKGSLGNTRDSELRKAIRDTIRLGLPPQIMLTSDDEDLFNLGVSSLQAIRIRNELQSLLPADAKALPSNIVYEQPSVARLYHLITALRSGTTIAVDDPIAEMKSLVKKMLFTSSTPRDIRSSRRTVLLTGATGALGAHILTSSPWGSDVVIVALVRADGDEQAAERVRTSLQRRGLSIEDERFPRCLAANYAKQSFGLPRQVYVDLENSVTDIVHAAWSVNFNASLSSFEDDHLVGIRELLKFSSMTSHSARLYFCSSTASVIQQPSPILEKLDYPAETAAPIGYARSKWVAEQLLFRARSDRICVLRVGQLCGDTKHGIWNKSEGWPLLILSHQITGCLPALDETIDWLPVDWAAAAIWDVTEAAVVPKVVHICSPDRSVKWSDILSHLTRAGLEFDVVTPREWLDRMDRSSMDLEVNPSRKMLDLWHRAVSLFARHHVNALIGTIVWWLPARSYKV
ncbi:uncharacterized protein L969DRAFT_69522 [Mixia osmundae IAM 14324]|uniref:uncharacterized protein n=1 Tax=Mixia osmundae (strain CBS 9802 / IAM 14324 / JCM 22182 / KY 12970) TaxID=764103 RepID=UPI0004A54CFC|nr:uncharacterized protein L969DRAFT_69522 [Mixia osmundae IAM 14324]KEI42452.1 hypothetical protein L969DRAFT_69522 [Mixia osmundae IAM 14324]